jgi:hypothetical protein
MGSVAVVPASYCSLASTTMSSNALISPPFYWIAFIK